MYTGPQRIWLGGKCVTEWSPGSSFQRDVVVIGGCGHVGLPLAIALADRGGQVGIYDVSQSAVAMVNAGQMHFAEPGAEDMLKHAVAAGRLTASTEPAMGTTTWLTCVQVTPSAEM